MAHPVYVSLLVHANIQHTAYVYVYRIFERMNIHPLMFALQIGAVQKWRHRKNEIFWPPPPPTLVTISGLPPPSPFTGANGDKLLPINGSLWEWSYIVFLYIFLYRVQSQRIESELKWSTWYLEKEGIGFVIYIQRSIRNQPCYQITLWALINPVQFNAGPFNAGF